MELKAYKMLAELRGSMLSQIDRITKNNAEFRKDKPDELYEAIESIANPSKWDKHSIISKENIAVLEVLEFLLNDNQEKIHKYQEWKPTKY